MKSDVNSAQIVIRRQLALSGGLWPFKVLVDGQKAGTLPVGGSLTVDMEPGRHVIEVGPVGYQKAGFSRPFEFEMAGGERLELVTGPTSAINGRPKIRRQDALSRRRTRRAPSDTALRPLTATRSTVIEESREEVAIGDETRVIDNSKSASPTSRVVRLTREWTRTCAVDVERTTTVRGSAALSARVLDLKAAAERTLSKTYSVTTAETRTFAEEVTLNIAQHTKSKIVFFWKEIRQKGVVQLAGEGFEVRIPYEVVVGITFDQQQIDAP